MLGKLSSVNNRYEEVERQLSDPKTLSDMRLFTKLNKEYKDLKPIVAAYHRYKKITEDIEGAKAMLKNEKDADMLTMAKAEIDELIPKKEQLEQEVRAMLVPKDPEDAKNAVLEIRAGTGGDEASIFAGDLYRMYMR